VNLSAGRGVAVREFPLKYGEADYLLFVDGEAVESERSLPQACRHVVCCVSDGDYARRMVQRVDLRLRDYAGVA
jgi:hypothetical protein